MQTDYPKTRDVTCWHKEVETNRRRFAEDIFICAFLNKNWGVLIWTSLKFVSKGPINNKSALV